MEEVRFTDSYSFKYSERPGTPRSATALGELDDTEVQARLERVQDLQRALTLDAHGARVGQTRRGPRRGRESPRRRAADRSLSRTPRS